MGLSPVNVFKAFFLPSPFWQIFAHFYKKRYKYFANLKKNVFETTNHRCHNTVLYNSNLMYNDWNKNNLSRYFSKRIKLLTQWDEQCFLME